MIALADVQTRLAAALVPDTLKGVDLLGELPGALDQMKGSPWAFVMPSQDRAGPDTMGTVEVRQRVVQQFAVLICFFGIGNLAAAQLSNIDTIRAAVRAQLVGWLPNPSDSGDPITYLGGKIVVADFDRSLIIWGEEFAGIYYVRA